MDAAIAETAIKVYLKEIHTRLEEAASIAKAADACAEAGNADKGVHVALDIEQLCYEATRLLDAASSDQPPRQRGLAPARLASSLGPPSSRQRHRPPRACRRGSDPAAATKGKSDVQAHRHPTDPPVVAPRGATTGSS